MILDDERLRQSVTKRTRAVRTAVLRWSQQNLRDFPWRRQSDPYRVFLAEVSLRRTTARAAMRAYDLLTTRYPDFEAAARATEEELRECFVSVGLQNARARLLHLAAVKVVEEMGGRLPPDMNALLSLPGVGLYAAGAILSLGFGVRAAMVDSNAVRLYSRLWMDVLPANPSPELMQAIGEHLVPEREHQVYNLAVIDLGALVCRFGRPRCSSCVLTHKCDYFSQGH
ncbi:MAG: hypothetical protein HXY34_00390 [Candidatus Thorarchaeota archaeon]|nr:hypothetical protein [Candidatus Thorarchaeota archaeon]